MLNTTLSSEVRKNKPKNSPKTFRKAPNSLKVQLLPHERLFASIVKNALRHDRKFLMKPGLLEDCAESCGLGLDICELIRNRIPTLDKR